MPLYHASCVEWEGKGVLFCGHSGSGKSDMSLRLIDEGAKLVADDRVDLCNRDGVLEAVVPERIKGLLEVRGLGIIPMPYSEKTEVFLKVDLCQACEIERMPDTMFETIEGVRVPVLKLDPKTASATAKVKLALSVFSQGRGLAE